MLRSIQIWFLLISANILDLVSTASAKDYKFFRRDFCRDDVLESLQNNTFWDRKTKEYFASDPVTGELLVHPDNITVTLKGCEEFCGRGTFYWDSGPRLVTWLIPVVLFVSNIELSPIDKKRFMTIIHALGDPIDSFWSIIHKIYIWDRLHAIAIQKCPQSLEEIEAQLTPFYHKIWPAIWGLLTAIGLVRMRTSRRSGHTEPRGATLREWVGGAKSRQRRKSSNAVGKLNRMNRLHRARIIATVLSGFEEISGSRIKSELHYHMIMHKLGRLGEDDEDLAKFEEWRKCARSLSDARTNEYLRTCLAIAVYFLGLLAAFVPSVGGGNTSPPGGRIGSAVVLSWLVPLVLLSNRVGAFTSRRACLHIMREFVAAATDPSEWREPILIHSADPRSAGSSSGVPRTRQPAPPSIEITPSPEQRTTMAFPSLRVQSIRPELWAQDVLAQMSAPGETRQRFTIPRSPPRRRSESSAPLASAGEAYGQAVSEDGSDVALNQEGIGYDDYMDHRQARGRSESIELDPLTPGGTKGTKLFVETAQLPSSGEQGQALTKVGLIRLTSWDEYYTSLQWLGAIYTYRPWKVHYRHVDHRTHAVRKSGIMALLGFFPVLVSALGASLILWYAVPVGFSCRNVWVIVIFCLWIISACVTTLLHVRLDTKAHDYEPLPSADMATPMGGSGGGFPISGSRSTKTAEMVREQRLWMWIMAKDAVIAFSCLLTIFLSAVGVFNNCWCWSVYMTRREQAVVPLNTETTYEHRASDTYSAIVVTSIGAQVLLFFGVTWYWRHGLGLVRWHEKDRRREWAHESDDTVQWNPKSFLLFWYNEEELDAQETDRQRRASAFQSSRRPTLIENTVRGSLNWVRPTER